MSRERRMSREQRTRTLAGRVVVVTRPRAQAGVLVEEIERRHGTAIVAPAIELALADETALRDAARQATDGAFEWVVLTSAAGVDAFTACLDEPPRVRAHVAAIGEATASALRHHGIEPDLVPAEYTTFALGRAMPRGRGRVLLARADIAPGELEAAIAARGWTPARVDAYRTTLATSLPEDATNALEAGMVDAVTFTSASTVRGFVTALHSSGVALPKWPPAVCIGPVTARAASDAGLEVAAVARPHTIEGLVAALERALAPSREEPSRP